MHTIKIDDKEIEISDESYEAFREQFIKDKRWKPSKGKLYYYVGNDGSVYSGNWYNDKTDKFNYEQGNCHRVLEGSQQHLQLLKAQAEIRNSSDFEPDWSDESELKYSVYYDHYIKLLRDTNNRHHQSCSLAYYPTQEAAEEAIKTLEKQYLRVFNIKGKE